MSEVKVNKISPRSGTGVQLGDSGDTITVPAGATLTGTQNIANTALTGSGQITINGTAVALGGSITLVTETRPTFSSITHQQLKIHKPLVQSLELILYLHLWLQLSIVLQEQLL